MLEHLSKPRFIQDIADFTAGGTWKYKGQEPAVILFHNEEHIFDKGFRDVYDPLSEKYRDIKFYQVIVDRDPEIAQAYDIHQFPATMFIPLEGKPVIRDGYMNRDEVEQEIEKNLLTSKEK